MKVLLPAQKQVIWLHVRGEGDRAWRKIRFTGMKTLLRFLEAVAWDFVGLLIVFERKSDHRVLEKVTRSPVTLLVNAIGSSSEGYDSRPLAPSVPQGIVVHK
jgi:hypothetical protein